MAIEDGKRIQAIGVSDPAGASRSHARQPPSHVIATAQFGLFRNEEMQKRTADVAKTNDCEVIGRNGPALSESMCRCCRQFCSGGRNEICFLL
jgi:hypothetical protein